MALLEPLFRLGAQLVLERPASKSTLEQFAEKLTESGAGIVARAQAAKDSSYASKTMRHITGIERWGQQRLRVFLGTSLVSDEYDGYQPSATLSLAEQCAAFQATRQETVALARELAVSASSATTKVLHNSFGPISARAWLQYLNFHAATESKRMR